MSDTTVLQDKLIKLGERVVDITNLAIDKTPEIYNQLYAAKILRMRIDAAVKIGGFLLAAILLGVGFYYCVKFTIEGIKNNNEPRVIAFGIAAAIIGAVILAVICNLFNSTLWITLINPEIILWSNFLDIVIQKVS